MTSFRIRPRFKHIIRAQQDELEQHICEALKQDEQFVYSYLSGHVYIRMEASQRHFWSPHLHLSFEQEGENVVVRGLYGPNPALWALFFFAYIIIGLLALFIGMWALSLWSLGKDLAILWTLPVLGAIALLLYVASQTGQKFGAQQMFDIHHFYESIVKSKVEVS